MGSEKAFFRGKNVFVGEVVLVINLKLQDGS